ncbi:hypothetical protein IMZ48_45010 [Candidatus Bathyarchaeota archaeon]|nr:hypothetical protein [Candidatus Bathyarchaeota archaeon]
MKGSEGAAINEQQTARAADGTALTYKTYFCPTFPASSSSLVSTTSYRKNVSSQYTWKKSAIVSIPCPKLASLQANIWGLTRIDKCLLVPVPLLHLRKPPFLFPFGDDDRPEVMLLFLFLFLPYGGEAEPLGVDEVDLFELRQGAFDFSR